MKPFPSMTRIFLSLATLAALLVCVESTQAGKVTAVQSEDAVKIMIDGEHFTTYNTASTQNKPYFHPVYAPGKTLVVREEVFGADGAQRNDLETNLGHHHHKGIWIAIDSINAEKLNYWSEKDKIRNNSVTVSQDGDNVVLNVHNTWVDPDNKPLIKEETKYTITPDRLLICELKLSAIDKPITFGDTKEGMFAVRLEKNLREVASGKIVNAEGKQTEKECWGLPSAWVDYSGEVNGKTVGIALFDDPANFRPSRYHVRAYGLFSINPFGEKSYSRGTSEAPDTVLQPGESVSLRYGLYVHEGATDSANIPAAHKKFVGKK